MNNKCSIVDYSLEWKEQLKKFLHQRFPRYSDEYIEYCLDHSLGETPSKIVVNDRGEIVGSHLLYCTKVSIKGSVSNTQWGHDTFLDEEYRSEIGLEFVLLTNKYHGFGLGLSEVNHELHKKLKTCFHEGVFTYYFLNRKVLRTCLLKLLNKTPLFLPNKTISVDGYIFRLVDNVKKMKIPDDGFWLKDKLDIDFIRDENFLNYRFFENKVFKYYVYSLDSIDNPCYFVVREVMVRGLPALILCDYRYDSKHIFMADEIIKAFVILAKQNKRGIMLFLCGDNNMKLCFSKRLHLKRPYDFISGKKEAIGKTFIVTAADSDADFNRC